MSTAKLSDFRPDPRNANKGTQKGREMLEKSIREFGAGRSVLADKNGVLIAGNKTMETAIDAGFQDCIVVETDGSKLVVVKRTDLDLENDPRAKALAVADNRVSEVSLEWDTDVLAQLNNEVDLSIFWEQHEIDDMLESSSLIVPSENNIEDAVGRIKSSPHIKAVIYSLDVCIFEKAMQATGIDNRGDALIAICNHYLESIQDETNQKR